MPSDLTRNETVVSSILTGDSNAARFESLTCTESHGEPRTGPSDLATMVTTATEPKARTQPIRRGLG
jgi:hypothetical protein